MQWLWISSLIGSECAPALKVQHVCTLSATVGVCVLVRWAQPATEVYLRRQSAYTRAYARAEYKPGLIFFVEEPIVRSKSTVDIILNPRIKICTFCAFVWLTGAPWICKATSAIYWEYDDVNFNFCLMATRWHNATNQKWSRYSFPCDVITHQLINTMLSMSVQLYRKCSKRIFFRLHHCHQHYIYQQFDMLHLEPIP